MTPTPNATTAPLPTASRDIRAVLARATRTRLDGERLMLLTMEQVSLIEDALSDIDARSGASDGARALLEQRLSTTENALFQREEQNGALIEEWKRRALVAEAAADVAKRVGASRAEAIEHRLTRDIGIEQIVARAEDLLDALSADLAAGLSLSASVDLASDALAHVLAHPSTPEKT